ncbi:DUF6346 domain-containing protein [Amycolatopsis suaedae]|uniref:Uncharacterized protein n=1 Tax=Amycolatopsis suaedae TaxID=2510978 RepID=A0A4Q7JEW2_9PSEU|nr:DUF6346 domain-containing protein [Amycolatopsis suaedae]RZQ65682.1 hypothetical protein EWH70_00875 [Amycolatopsis suaedae]
MSPPAGAGAGERTSRGHRRWSVLSPGERALVVVQLLVQGAVRAALVVFALVVFLTATPLIGGKTGRTGTAELTGCASGDLFGWVVACQARVTWPDGEITTHRLESADLTAGDSGRSVRAVEHGSARVPTAVALDLPHRYTALGWSLLTSVAGVALLWPYWWRGRPPRAGPAVAVLTGYWLIVTGALGAAVPHQPALTGVTIVAGHLVLVAGLVRSRKPAAGRKARPVAGWTLLAVAVAALLWVVLGGLPWTSTGLPVALLVAGIRLVWRARRPR